MEAVRRAPSALVLSRMLISVLVVVGIIVFVRGALNGPQEAPLVDNGPNAGLSNAELVAVAITNMKALKSYRFEFQGGLPRMEVRMSSNLSITGDVQLHGKGARWSVRDLGGGVCGTAGMNLDVGAGIDGIRATGGGWWESYDGGKTWSKPIGDTQLSVLLLWLDCRWGNLFEDGGAAGDSNLCEGTASQLNLTDGTPRLEKVGGVVTRHMVGVFGDQQAQANGQAVTVDLWVSTDDTPTLRRMRVEGSNKLYDNIVEAANAVAFSPDGKTLAAAHGWSQDGTIRLYDANSPGAPQRKLTGGHVFYSVDFSADGALLAATGMIPTDRGVWGLYIWDLTKPDASLMTRTVGTDLTYAIFQPKGHMLAAGSSSGIYLWDARDANATPTVLPVPAGISVEEMAFSADGNSLAVGTWEEAATASGYGVLIFDLRDPRKVPIHLQGKDAGDHVAVSPDGQLLATVGSGQVTLWSLANPQAPVATLPAATGQYASAAFSPDGRFLATLAANDQLALWDLALLQDPGAAHSPAVQLDGGAGGMTSIAFSPDGKRLAVSSDDGSVLVWKTDEAVARQRAETAKPQVFHEEQTLINKPFTLTWTWSRFNEDFGEVRPPPTETIR